MFTCSSISILYPSKLRLTLDNLIAANIYVLCAVPNVNSNTRRSVKGNSSIGNHFSISRSTISTFQTLLYLSFIGLSMKTSLKNLNMFLFLSKLFPLIKEITDLIELSDPYVSPSSNFFVLLLEIL